MTNLPISQRNRLTKERRQRIPHERLTWPDPTVCQECGVVYSSGRWAWQTEAPEKHYAATCPACQRISQRYPAGYLEIRGDFYPEHQEEILNLIHNVETLQKASYPLERLIAIDERADHILVTTTGVHVARRIGEALARAYQGEFTFQYGDDEKLIRGSWTR